MNQRKYRRMNGRQQPRGFFMHAINAALFGGMLFAGMCGALFNASPSHAQTPTVEPAVETITPAVTRSVAQTTADAVQRIAGGVWVKTSYAIAGRWAIVMRGGKSYIEFDDDFKTRRGPDLKVYLSTRAVEQLSDRTVAANAVEIAALKRPRGAQQYEIPARLDLNDYRAVLIHCKRFSHLWGGGNFAP